MRHAHDHGLDAQLGRPVHDLLHGGDHDLDALQAEALLGAVLLGKEVLEAGGAGDPGGREGLFQAGRSSLLAIDNANVKTINIALTRLLMFQKCS